MLQEVKNALDEEGFNYKVHHQEKHQEVLMATFTCSNGNVATWIDMRPDEGVFIISAMCPIHVDSSKETQLLKLLNGLSQRTYLGHWEYDAETGQIKVRVAQAASGPFPLHGETFMKIYRSTIDAMDFAIPAISGIGFASMQADNALHRMFHGVDPSMN